MNDSADRKLMMDMLVSMGEAVSEKVSETLRREGSAFCSEIDAVLKSDVIYRIDRVAEEVILKGLEYIAGDAGGIILVAEGINESAQTVFPANVPAEKAAWKILLDPIDGTRGLMVDKRSAFFLAGAAPNKGAQTTLLDIEIAVMVEIPTTKMNCCDTLTASRGRGINAIRRNLVTGEKMPFVPKPSKSPEIRGGYAHLARFFTPGKAILAQIEEELMEVLYPDAEDGEIVAFEDQYISSGGQLYELVTGKDRFVADLRKSLYSMYRESFRSGHVCHPYDLAAHLIGVEAGLIITDIHGKPLDGPLDTQSPMDWIGYANASIHLEVSPVLNSLLKKYKLL